MGNIPKGIKRRHECYIVKGRYTYDGEKIDISRTFFFKDYESQSACLKDAIRYYNSRNPRRKDKFESGYSHVYEYVFTINKKSYLYLTAKVDGKILGNRCIGNIEKCSRETWRLSKKYKKKALSLYEMVDKYKKENDLEELSLENKIRSLEKYTFQYVIQKKR